jgi:hypothetical protein
MGTLYYAVGKNNRQAIELGKSCFDFLLDKKWDEPSLVKALAGHFTEGPYASRRQIPDYAKEVAAKLLSIDTEFEVVSEHHYASPYEGVMITQSRFRERTCVGETLSSHLSD